MKLTPWFSGDQKPVRPGVYQRRWEGAPFFSYWTGVWWGALSLTKEIALEMRFIRSGHQLARWRGILRNGK